MSQWRINPAGVQGILTTVGTDSTELQNELTEAKFTEVFEGLTWGGVLTQDVPVAVQSLLNDQNNNLSNVVNRITAARLGVTNATIAYNNGQEEAAGTFQSEALAAAESGDFTYFVENGYGSEQ
jgi:hypothetical protein